MKRRSIAGEVVPNLAPMVDVIMVLLIFFLCGTTLNLVPQGILQTELDPSSGPGAGAAITINPTVRIALTDVDDGAGALVHLNNEALGELTAEPLRAWSGPEDRAAAYAEYLGPLYVRLSERASAGADLENPVVIGADTAVRWKYVIKAMDAAVNAGFKNIQFAVSFRATSQE